MLTHGENLLRAPWAQRLTASPSRPARFAAARALIGSVVAGQRVVGAHIGFSLSITPETRR